MLRIEALSDLASPEEPLLDSCEWDSQCIEFLHSCDLQVIDWRRVIASGGLWNARNEVPDDISNSIQVLFLEVSLDMSNTRNDRKNTPGQTESPR